MDPGCSFFVRPGYLGYNSSVKPFLTCLLASLSSFATSHDLRQCYDKALKINEAVLISELEIQKAEYQKKQTLSGALPRLSYRHDIFWQEKTQTGTGVGTAFTRSPLPEGRFNVNLPLFRGLTEWYAVETGKDYVEQRREEKRFLELDTFSRIAEPYFDVLLLQKNLELTDRALKLSDDRLRELTKFIRLGRSRRSESLELENQINQLRNQRVQFGAQIQSGLANLSSLVGEPIAELAPIEDFLSHRPTDRAAIQLDQRQDLMARETAVDVARGAVRSIRTEHLPGVDANFNYYTQRSGIREGIDWDFNLGIFVPLYGFGNTRDRVQEAVASLKQAELALSQARREARLEVDRIWNDLSASVERLPMAERSVSLTRDNYQMQEREYRLGLVNNFQVLDALQRNLDAEIDFERLKLEASFQVIRLYLAQGRLPPGA